MAYPGQDSRRRSNAARGSRGGRRDPRGGGSGGMRRPSVRGRQGRGYSLSPRNIRFTRGNSIFNRLDIDPRKLLVLLLAVLLAILLLVKVGGCIRGCTSPSAPQADTNPVDGRVAGGIPEDLTKRLASALDRNDKLAWVAEHADQFTDASLVELALAEPSAVDFVAAYPSANKSSSAFDSSVTKGTAPELYDWDSRWGNVNYADSALAVTGSGPTTLSMAYMGLTGSNDKTPADIAALVTQAQLASGESHMDASFVENHAADLGLVCKAYSPSADDLTSVLDAGTYIAIEAKAATLTDAAHWVLLVTQNEDGSVVVYDPTSTAVTAHPWDAATLAAACGRMYALTTAPAAGTSPSSSSSAGA